MYIVYTSPVDGLPRARKVQSFREAGLVMASLEEMGCNPEVEDDMEEAKKTALPLLVSPWQPMHIVNMMDHQEDASAITI